MQSHVAGAGYPSSRTSSTASGAKPRAASAGRLWGSRSQSQGPSQPSSHSTQPAHDGGNGQGAASTSGSGLGAVCAGLEEVEEARGLRQARVAAKIRAQVGAGQRRPARPKSSRLLAERQKWWEAEPNAPGEVTLEAMVWVVRTLCTEPSTPLPAPFVAKVLDEAETLLRRARHSTVTRVPMPEQESGAPLAKVIIVGDTHGQLEDVLWIFTKHGLPSRSLVYLFNGDIADRGSRALEIFVLALGFMVACPASVYINRGNHEDESMNHSGCGGFYNECLAKYGRGTGGLLYNQMKSIYTVMPLAAILKDSVFVVHGGLSRCAHLLKLLEGVQQRGVSLPAEPHGNHELAMVDALWSDPSDRPGLTPSMRGGHLVAFGPDITHKFLRETGLSLVVRSHEVPKNNDGVSVMHSNRLVTVFSASNYCGTTGNQGAVLIFHEGRGKLGFDVSRHFAPALSGFQAYGEVLAGGGSAEFLQAAQRVESLAQQQALQRDPSSARLHQDVLRQVAQLVVEHKPALWAFFFQQDNDKSGFVDVQTWQDGCAAVLGDLPWTQLQNLLVQVEESSSVGPPRVDYVAFVQRFRVGIVGDEVSDTWADGLITTVFTRLMHSDWTLSELLDFFDHDRNGTVTLPELRDALLDLDIGITEYQTAALMRTISAHASKDSRDPAGGIDVVSFLTRFELAFRPLAAKRNVPHWVTGALRCLGREIWTLGPQAARPDAKEPPATAEPEARAAEFFQVADTDGDGLLSPQELATALRNMGVASNLSEDELHELARWIDVTGEGQISYLEFISSFTPGDALAGQTLQLDIMESVCTAIWANKPALLSGCLCFDGDHSGKISRDQLSAALHALNAISRPLLTEEQITVLLNHTRFHPKTGTIRYRRFLDSFQVFDNKPPQGTEPVV